MPWNSLPSWQTHIALGRLESSVADLPIRLSTLCESVAIADPGVAKRTVPSKARLPVTVRQSTILRDAIVHLLSVVRRKGGLDRHAAQLWVFYVQVRGADDRRGAHCAAAAAAVRARAIPSSCALLGAQARPLLGRCGHACTTRGELPVKWPK